MFGKLYPYPDRVELILTSYENFIGSIPKNKLNEAIKQQYGQNYYWQDFSQFNLWLSRLKVDDELTDEEVFKIWALKKWAHDISENTNNNYLPCGNIDWTIIIYWRYTL